jgi:caffeoyl-CoA O-methyltransferase
VVRCKAGECSPHPPTRSLTLSPLCSRLLSQLSSLVNPRRVLELGTFTGYATLCLAEGMAQPSSRGGLVVTVDKDRRATEIAEKYFQRASLPKVRISSRPPPLSLPPSRPDTTKVEIQLKLGSVADLLLSLAKEEGTAPFDLVFIDADKRSNWSYLSTLLGSDQQRSLLAPGALIVTDNTLWKGRVLSELEPPVPVTLNQSRDKKEERRDQLTKTIHEFNLRCASHPALKTVLLPLRDGLTISRYQPPA